MGLMSDIWYKRTELEKGLILILIVLVPILLLICGIYIFSSIRKIPFESRLLELNDSQQQTRQRRSPIFTKGNEIIQDLSLRKKRSVENCICPEVFNNCNNTLFEPEKFISSVSETIFEDDSNEFKFKCSAVLITENYILTFPNCLSKNSMFKIRSASEFWSKNGYIRKILKFSVINNTFTIAKLSNPLPNDGFSVKLIDFLNPDHLKIIKQFFAYRWDTKFTSVFKQRKKYDKLNKIRLNVTKCSIDFNGLCALEPRKPYLNDNLDDRDPIFEINSNKLIGIEVKRLIREDKIEHYYLFIKHNDIQNYIL